MKTPILLLSAASLLFAAASSHAAPANDLQAFADRAYAQAAERLDAANVETPQPVTVKAYIASGGRLTGVRVTGSSGSRDTDYAVEQALKKMTVADAPAALVGSTLTLRFGPAPIVQANSR